jgi:DNA-binding PadR family transcriptional regulator
MPTAPAALIRDFLEWLAAAPRSYAEAMEAWRTSCPRLTVWEDAVDEGLIVRRVSEGAGVTVELTPAGRAWLARHRGGDDADRDPQQRVRHP